MLRPPSGRRGSERIAADVDVERARRVAPGEQAADDERDPEGQQQSQERPLLTPLAVDRHQGQIEQHGDRRPRARRRRPPGWSQPLRP